MRVLELPEEELKKALSSGKLTVAVYGLGYVGTPLLAAWLLAGASGIGVDVDASRVERVRRGVSPVMEPGVEEVFRRALKEGRLKATSDGIEASRESDVKIIAVPVPLREEREKMCPDFTALEEVARDIGRGLKEGDLVILESSVPPGTTRNLLRPILEETSGLKAEIDFGLAYSPERIYVGRALADIVERYPKVIGGYGPKSARTAKALYEVVSQRGVLLLSSDVAAEFEKLAEGVYRDVNIALANQLAILASKLGVEYEEIREAANSQPFCHLHKPGTGVGGACIPIYPHFVIHAARFVDADVSLVKLAREVNSTMPKYVAGLAVKGTSLKGIRPEEANVCVLGVAFRGGGADTRLSPTYDLIAELRARGFGKIRVHDPLVRDDPNLPEGIPLFSDLREALKGCNVVILATDHKEYVGKSVKELAEWTEVRPLVIVDGRDVLDASRVPEGVAYLAVGRPTRVG